MQSTEHPLFAAHDCYELGRIAYNQGDYYHTLLWMQEALDHVEHEHPPTASEPDIVEYLAYAMYQQGNLKRALSLTKRLKRTGTLLAGFIAS